MELHSISIKIKELLPIPRVIKIVNTLLVLLLLWVAGIGIARVLEHTVFIVPFQAPKFVPSEKRDIDRPVALSEFQSIIEQNVFNAEVQQQALPQEPVITNTAPSVDLRQILSNLTLMGTVQRPNQFSLCVIRHKRKNQEELFAVGDEIFDTGAIVRAITMTPELQRVQVLYNNETGYLTLSEVEETVAKKETRPSPSPRSRRPSVARQPAPQTVTNDYTTDGKNYYISSEEVDAELNNFAKLLNQARMVPYFRKGQHQGYQVKAIDKGSLYEKLGLRNRDIIEEINGEPLDSMEKVMGLFNRLRNEREFNVKIKRNGISQDLKYYIN